VQKSQKLNTKTKSYNRCHPRTTNSSLTFSLLVAAAMCTLKGFYFRATSESLWKGVSERTKHLSFANGSKTHKEQGGESTNESTGA